jgi:hypothetical protein
MQGAAVEPTISYAFILSLGVPMIWSIPRTNQARERRHWAKSSALLSLAMPAPGSWPRGMQIVAEGGSKQGCLCVYSRAGV